MRPIEIKAFGKSLTNCHASCRIFDCIHMLLLLLLLCYDFIFFPSYIHFNIVHFWLIRIYKTTPSIERKTGQSLKLATSKILFHLLYGFFFVHLPIVNSLSFGNRQLFWNSSKYDLLVKETHINFMILCIYMGNGVPKTNSIKTTYEINMTISLLRYNAIHAEIIQFFYIQ